MDYPSGKGLQTRYELGDIRGQSPQMNAAPPDDCALCPLPCGSADSKQGRKRARRRRFTRRSFTASLTVGIAIPLSPSIAARLPSRCWKRNCLVMKGAFTGSTTREAGPGCFEIARRHAVFWMKSAKCPCRYKPGCAYWRKSRPRVGGRNRSVDVRVIRRYAFTIWIGK